MGHGDIHWPIDLSMRYRVRCRLVGRERDRISAMVGDAIALKPGGERMTQAT